MKQNNVKWPHTLRRKRGVAIVTAMLIAFLATTVISFMIWSEDRFIRQVENVSYRTQADALALAVIKWVGKILLEASTNNEDQIGARGPETVSVFSVEQGEVTAEAENMQGKFNINNLIMGDRVSEHHVIIFKRLLNFLELPEKLADSVADWLDPDSVVRPNFGAEDEYYQSLDPPYITANMLISDITELRKVKGFSDSVIETLRPHVTVLPKQTRLHVNSATPETLAAHIGSMKLPEAEALANSLERTPAKTMVDFRQLLPKQITGFNEIDFTTRSFFYMVLVVVKIDRALVGYDSMIMLNQTGKSSSVVWLKGS